MTEWFRTAFGAEYLSLYAHRDEQEAQSAVDLILRSTGLPPGSHMLDAPCGSGRHVRAFAAAGMKSIGIDLSRELLQVGSKIEMPGTSLVRADLRSLPFAANSFPLVTNLFSSFGYMETEEQNAAVLFELARVCSSGGHMVVDFMNATQVRATLQPHSERFSKAGCKVSERRWIAGSPARVNKETIASSPAGETKSFYETVRLYERDELQHLMEQAGLKITSSYGNYTGDSWTDTSHRVILIGKKQ